MNRRNIMFGLAAAPLAATSISFAQGGPGTGGSIGANLIALLPGGQGTFAIQRFAAIDGALNAIGTLTATNGTVTGVTTLAVLVSTVQSLDSTSVDPPASCPILNLTLGPIHLNLLGLVVDVSAITINIVAIPGAGNLLGNLLCDIANLLNPGGTLTGVLNQLVALLNQLLGSL